MSDKRRPPPRGYLVGLNGFSELWTAICKDLIANKLEYLKQLPEAERRELQLPRAPTPDFAPQGAFREIVTIDSGTAFATIAKRACDYGYFNPPDFADAVLEAELAPFGFKPTDLSAGGRDRALNRIGMSITRLMKTFVFFGLFERVKTFHRLTELGVKTYEKLSEDPPDEEEPVAIDTGGGLQFLGRYSGVGTARGGHTQVTLHRYY